MTRTASFASFAPFASGAALVVALVGVACDGAGTVGETELLGREGKVVFGAETKLAFTQRLVAGSAFAVSFRSTDPEELPLTGATLRSSDEDVLTIEPGAQRVSLVTPGTADLEVIVAGAVVDAVALHAGKVGATTLVDKTLIALTDTIDSRLPASFAIRTDADHTVLIAAVDVCGGDLLDLHASTVESADPAGPAVPVSIEDGGAAAFTVTTQIPGELSLVLKTPGLDDLSYAVQSVDPGQVDEVSVGLTQADEGGGVILWGRAFVDDVELIGDLQLSWLADPRVTLTALQGTVVSGSVSFPVEGEPADERPAVVTAEIFGEAGSVDVLTVTALTNSRGTPARELVVEEPTPSCGGGDATAACNPEAALLVLLGARRLRALRRRLDALARPGSARP